jgi:hypothetical protein
VHRALQLGQQVLVRDDNEHLVMESLLFMFDLKKQFVPYKSPFKKVRVGNEGDGGYVVADIPCDVCYSYGSNDEISF